MMRLAGRQEEAAAAGESLRVALPIGFLSYAYVCLGVLVTSPDAGASRLGHLLQIAMIPDAVKLFVAVRDNKTVVKAPVEAIVLDTVVLRPDPLACARAR
eukprot:scaffold1722_cov380-Prasinococcus_capsulatus_cf.AAC.3